jgi:hypothetical protein
VAPPQDAPLTAELRAPVDVPDEDAFVETIVGGAAGSSGVLVFRSSLSGPVVQLRRDGVGWASGEPGGPFRLERAGLGRWWAGLTSLLDPLGAARHAQGGVAASDQA